MKRFFLLSIYFVAALALIVACTQASTPTQDPPAAEETTEELPADTLPPSPAATATEAPATAAPTDPPAETETEAPGDVEDVEALIVDRCSQCHDADRVFRANKTESEWDDTIERMVDYGANVNEDEKAQMIEWLISREE